MSRWTRENLEAALVGAVTYSDILQNLGLKQIGRNNQTLQKYMKLYGLEFTSRPWLKRDYTPFRKLDDVDLYVANSATSRGVIRRRILADKLIPYQCTKCGNVGQWNGETISLQLEHKNGINDDHRLENLEFLCPNCHSQTSSWAGRNRCKQHNTEKKPETLKARAPVKARSADPFTKDELEQLMAEYTLTTIGKLYNMSGNAVRRWCKKWHLPLPGQGNKNRGLV